MKSKLNKGLGVEKEKNLYLNSKGLEKAEVIKKGQLFGDSDLVPDYENDYVCVKWFDDDSCLKYIK